MFDIMNNIRYIGLPGVIFIVLLILAVFKSGKKHNGNSQDTTQHTAPTQDINNNNRQ